MKYEIPDNIKLLPVECFGQCDKTRKAIIAAVIMLDYRPNFTPKYASVFGNIMADNKETIQFHKEAFDHAGDINKHEDRPNLPFPNDGVDLATFAIAITGIKKYGFYEYIFLLEQAELRKKQLRELES